MTILPVSLALVLLGTDHYLSTGGGGEPRSRAGSPGLEVLALQSIGEDPSEPPPPVHLTDVRSGSFDPKRDKGTREGKGGGGNAKEVAFNQEAERQKAPTIII